MSFAEQRLNRDLTEEPDMLDESEINNDDLNFIQLATANGKRYVNKLPLRVFRKLLANHFHKQKKMLYSQTANLWSVGYGLFLFKFRLIRIS